MKMLHSVVALALATTVNTCLAKEVVYSGMCDASAAVYLGQGEFVVANDEDNALRVYSLSSPGAALRSVELQERFIGPGDAAAKDGKFPEADIEGAARVGNLIYWITSHGANYKGKERLARRKLFVTEIEQLGATAQLRLKGAVYPHLIQMFNKQLGDKYGLLKASEKAPEGPKGLNIEGLAAGPDGSLLIGLRNPVPRKKGLILQLLNPAQLVADATEAVPAKFGPPIELKLGGLGIRNIEPLNDQGEYLLIAGAVADGKFALYRWKFGDPAAKRLDVTLPAKMRPEAMFIDAETVYLLSDDGDEDHKGTLCKDLKDPSQQTFRLMSLALPR